MKIDFKDKSTLFIIIVAAVVIIPILYNTLSSFISGQIAAYQMSLPKTVQVMHPAKLSIYPQIETTGRLDSKCAIQVIARISGWLQKAYFREGDIVKEGQKLYTIEPDEYLYAARNAQATVEENKAVFKNSEIELERAEFLLKEDFVSRQYYDDAVAKRNRDRAALDGSVAQLNTAKLNLSYTNITAPITGRIGKMEISAGNYVTAASGALTTIYATDPMRVIFSIKSSDFMRIKKHYIETKKSADKNLPVDVFLKLADGSMYNKTGHIEYFDNKIEEDTGTVNMRAIFDNPDELLMHGDFVNVILKLKETEEVMTIPQSATKTDVGTGYYVWVVKDGKTVKKNIEVTQNIDNNWVVKSGLDYDDVVIVKGIQDIYKSGQAVKTEDYVPDKNNTTNKQDSGDKE